jgi:hypothetical protein
MVNGWEDLENDEPPAPLIRAPFWVLRLLLGISALGALALIFIAVDLSPIAGALPLIAILLGCALLAAGWYFRRRQRRLH